MIGAAFDLVMGSKVVRWLLFIAAAAAAVLFAVLRIRNSGRMAERAENQIRAMEDIKEAQNVQREIDRLPAGVAAERLRNEWGRK